MDTQLLIATVPAEQLLGLVILFIGSALVLLLLAIEAGHYADLAENWRSLRRKLRWTHPRRWALNRVRGQKTQPCALGS